jgi:hypothetical protein
MWGSSSESLTSLPSARSSRIFPRTPQPLRPGPVTSFRIQSMAAIEKSEGGASPVSSASSTCSGGSTAPRSTIVRNGFVTGIRFRTVVWSATRSVERWTVARRVRGHLLRATVISTTSSLGSTSPQIRAAARWEATAPVPAARQAASTERSQDSGAPARENTPGCSLT